MRIRESSANKRCETDGAFLHTLTPSLPPASSSNYSILDRPSAHKRNKNVDKGSPCWRPLVGVTPSVSWELYLIVYFTKETQFIIKFTHWPSKPNFSIIFLEKTHSTLSYALCMSNLTAQSPDCPFLLFLILGHTHKLPKYYQLLIYQAQKHFVFLKWSQAEWSSIDS